MAPLMTLRGAGVLPIGATPQSALAEREKERRRIAEQMQREVRSYAATHAMLGPEIDMPGVNVDQLMPSPDKVAWRTGDYSTYDDMARNVLVYKALNEKAKDVVESCDLQFLAGRPGDPESERARDVVQAAYEGINDLSIAMRHAQQAYERGFGPLENVWDIHDRGAARGFWAPKTLITIPINWIGFDWHRQPMLKESRYKSDGLALPGWKVSFMRCGSNFTGYGSGYGQDAYPTVWTMQHLLLGAMKELDRFGYFPIVGKVPRKWSDERIITEKVTLASQWPNVILVRGDVDELDLGEPLGATTAYSGASANIKARLDLLRVCEQWLHDLIQGSMSSSGNQAEGSFARDAVASNDRMWKAPSFAAVKESMINRDFIRPVMMVNFPALEEDAWPHAAIDAKFAEDLSLFMSLCERGVKMGMRISQVVVSERTKIPLAKDGDVVLTAPATSIPITDPVPIGEGADAVGRAVKAMSEPVVRVWTKKGMREYRPDDAVYIEGRGVERAIKLQKGFEIVDDPTMFAAVQ